MRAIIGVLVSCNACALVHTRSSFFGRSIQHRRSISHPEHDDHTEMSLHMKVKVGLIGLPNVGKSTLFNALARQSIAQAANFPFCTIEPNIAPIAIPDPYLPRLGELAQSVKTLSATMEFVDVAGLVQGASRGEGLGNRFLATIRECQAVCHVIRTFEDPDIVHVSSTIEKGLDPIQDAEDVNLELLLADIGHIERRLAKKTCLGEERDTLERLLPQLQSGLPGRSLGLSDSEELSIRSMGLLTLKPVVYVFNVDEVDFILDKDDTVKKAEEMMTKIQYCDPSIDTFAVVSAKLESKISCMETLAEQRHYLETIMDIPEGGLSHNDELNSSETLPIMMSYDVLPATILRLLHLIVVYTGPGVPTERSRTTKSYLYSAQPAPTTFHLAERLHGTIAQGFIRAEVVSASKILEYESYGAAKDDGAIRGEGKDAKLADGDVVCIKWK